MTKLPEVWCRYCGALAELADSETVYPSGRRCGKLWVCRPCGAWVGVHRDSPTFKPKGHLANAELRAARIEAHRAFDPLWRRKMVRDNLTHGEARSAGYRWLSEQLGKADGVQAHIGFMDLDECRRVAEVCAPFKVGEDG